MAQLLGVLLVLVGGGLHALVVQGVTGRYMRGILLGTAGDGGQNQRKDQKDAKSKDTLFFLHVT